MFGGHVRKFESGENGKMNLDIEKKNWGSVQTLFLD